MKNENTEDFNTIKNLLEEGRFKLDNPDFEEALLSKIILEKNYKVRIKKLIGWSFACFIGGLILSAMLVSWLLFNSSLRINSSYEIISIICLFSLGVIGVLFIDNFLKLLRNYKVLN